MVIGYTREIGTNEEWVQGSGFENKITWENNGRESYRVRREGRLQAKVGNGNRRMGQILKALRHYHLDGD